MYIVLCKIHLVLILFMSLGYADPRHTTTRHTTTRHTKTRHTTTRHTTTRHTTTRHTTPRHIRKFIQSFPVPWVGVLSHREPKSEETLTGITLIKTKLGLANAYDVGHISKKNIRNTTQAMFLAVEGAVRYAYATDYDIHPEYIMDTLNTIALVHLDYDQDRFDWLLMDWPREDEEMMHHLGDVYAFGYVANHGALKQVMHAMQFVSQHECDKFYETKDLGSEWVTPTEFECFRQEFSREKCVYGSGMTLAVHYAGTWKLLGISVPGPGCALPARFIDFAAYVPWAQKVLATHQDYM